MKMESEFSETRMRNDLMVYAPRSNPTIVALVAVGLLGATSSSFASPKSDLKAFGKRLQTDVALYTENNPDFRREDRCGLKAYFGGADGNIVIAVSPRQKTLKPGDKIISVNDATEDSLAVRLSKIAKNAIVDLQIIRDGQKLLVSAQCTDIKIYYSTVDQLFEKMAKGQPDQCITAVRRAGQITGYRYLLHHIEQHCLYASKYRNSYWVNNQYPTILYQSYIHAIDEQALIGIYDDSQFDAYWSIVLSAMTELSNRGFSHLATDLKRHYESKKLNSVSAATRPSEPRPTYARTASGTCFVVSTDGRLITNYHVIDGAETVTVELSDGRKFETSIEATSPSTDLAVLRVKARDLAYLPLSAIRSASVGMEVFTMGFPVTSLLGSEPKFTDGTISALSGLAGESSLMQISVPIQPGNSGGPLVTDSGAVVGIVTSTAAVGNFIQQSGTLPQNVNWAVKADYARMLFDVPDSKMGPTDRQQAISDTRLALCRVHVELR